MAMKVGGLKRGMTYLTHPVDGYDGAMEASSLRSWSGAAI